MFKKLAVPALFACGLFVSACQKNDDPQPQPKDPEAEVKLERTTTYLTASRYNNKQGYSQRTLQSTATLSTNELYLNFDAVEGKDAIVFTLPKASLAPTFIGTYELRTSTSSQVLVPAATYTYYITQSFGSLTKKLYGGMKGQLTITAYDAQRQLLTGSYQARLEDIIDPADGNGFSSGALRCNVEVTGSFTNLKVQ